MFNLKIFFKRFDKTKYPKIVRHWSFSALFLTPVFTIGNKLWFFTIIYLAVYLFRILFHHILPHSKSMLILMLLVYSIYFIFVIYLMIYGRILAWEKLGYKDTEQDILKFRQRQKSVLFWGILLFISEIVTLYFYLSLIGFS